MLSLYSIPSSSFATSIIHIHIKTLSNRPIIWIGKQRQSIQTEPIVIQYRILHQALLWHANHGRLYQTGIVEFVSDVELWR